MERKSQNKESDLILLFLVLAFEEANSILMEENKNLLSANPDESLQAVAEIHSAFNSLIMLLGENADILGALLLVMFEA